MNRSTTHDVGSPQRVRASDTPYWISAGDAPTLECFAPPSRLRAVVAFFWTVRCEADVEPAAELVPPDADADLIYLHGDSRQSIVRGPQGRLTSVRLAPAAFYIGARLKPGIAPWLSHRSSAEIFNRRLGQAPMDAELSDFLDGPAKSRAPERAIEVLADFLQRVLPEGVRAGDDGIGPQALRLIQNSSGLMPISEVSRRLNCSDRHLRRALVAAMGFSPKGYACVVRFRQALRQVTRTDCPLAQIAWDRGYTDQAHMTREFARLAGCSPFVLRRQMSAFDKNGREDADTMLAHSK
jgi:AraC-like DNA-binding protein